MVVVVVDAEGCHTRSGLWGGRLFKHLIDNGGNINPKREAFTFFPKGSVTTFWFPGLDRGKDADWVRLFGNTGSLHQK